MEIRYFFSTKHPSLFWEIRRRIRKADPFNYFTKIRRKENNCCTKCGTTKDNDKHWKRVIIWEKR